MLIKTRSLAKRFGDVVALKDCDFGVAAGEVCGLLGPNGSGKTTLLRLLMGFLRPTGGVATIDSLDCWRDSAAVHRMTAYLPGEVRFERRDRCRRVIEFFSRIRPDGDLAAAERIAGRLGLDVSRQVARASTGMRQMLALACTFSVAAPLLILDEPTTNLEPSARGEVLDMVRGAKAAGRTVVFSSHVLSEVEQVCDRVVLLRRGEPVHAQLMSQLRRRHVVRARLAGAVPVVPQSLAGAATLAAGDDGRIEIETAGDLPPLLAWLSTLSVKEMRIEPVGLSAIYRRYHKHDPA